MDRNDIASLIEQVFLTISSTPPPETPDLDTLFERLQTSPDPEVQEDSEFRIWNIWCSHEDVEAAQQMHNVVQSFNQGDTATADQQLSELIERWPDWAEGWNKRATLRFAQERDEESLNDIIRTLSLEPRHFGAFGGFGQICLRAGDAHSALLAFQYALELNPAMSSMRDAVSVLRRQNSHTVH